VTRLKEARDNSEKLATLADEMASAKEEADEVAEDLQAARDTLID
jgi:DNA repair ATPase RecN